MIVPRPEVRAGSGRIGRRLRERRDKDARRKAPGAAAPSGPENEGRAGRATPSLKIFVLRLNTGVQRINGSFHCNRLVNDGHGSRVALS